jgi:hypothetical protein
LPASSRRLATALLALLLAGPACGKKGDPQPPLRRAPQGPAEFAVAQRGERVVVSLRAPRAWSDGARLPVVELELLRADRAGDLADVARSRRIRAAPGEALTESEPVPAPGTRLRFAVRTRADGKQSPLSRVLALLVQAPPPAPSSLTAERAEGRVRLAWTPPVSLAPPVPATPPGEAAPLPPGAPGEAPPAPAPPTVPPSEPADDDAPPASSPAPPGAATQPSPKPAPAPPGFWPYRRASDEAYAEPLSKTPVAGAGFDDETPPPQAVCYVVRTVLSSDPVVESADSNEACVPAKPPEPGATPGASLP